METTNKLCTLCGVIEKEMHVTGIKRINDILEAYCLCKDCCSSKGKGIFNEEDNFRQKLFAQLEIKLLARQKKQTKNKNEMETME